MLAQSKRRGVNSSNDTKKQPFVLPKHSPCRSPPNRLNVHAGTQSDRHRREVLFGCLSTPGWRKVTPANSLLIYAGTHWMVSTCERRCIERVVWLRRRWQRKRGGINVFSRQLAKHGLVLCGGGGEVVGSPKSAHRQLVQSLSYLRFMWHRQTTDCTESRGRRGSVCVCSVACGRV